MGVVKGIAPNFAVTLMLLSLFPESFGIFSFNILIILIHSPLLFKIMSARLLSISTSSSLKGGVSFFFAFRPMEEFHVSC